MIPGHTCPHVWIVMRPGNRPPLPSSLMLMPWPAQMHKNQCAIKMLNSSDTANNKIRGKGSWSQVVCSHYPGLVLFSAASGVLSRGKTLWDASSQGRRSHGGCPHPHLPARHRYISHLLFLLVLLCHCIENTT